MTASQHTALKVRRVGLQSLERRPHSQENLLTAVEEGRGSWRFPAEEPSMMLWLSQKEQKWMEMVATL
jgi:hypothetical protein